VLGHILAQFSADVTPECAPAPFRRIAAPTRVMARVGARSTGAHLFITVTTGEL